MIGQYFNVDCLAYMKTVDDRFFDLAIVDPPYGIGYSTDAFKKSGKQGRRAKAPKNFYANKNWDQSPPEDDYFKELFRVSKNQIIWGANHFIEKINKNSSAWIVWDKDNSENKFSDCELAWTSFSSAVRRFKYRWHGMLQQDMRNKESRIHPTQKPIKLYEWLLSRYAQKGDIIFDSHVGSGSSLIACENLGFKYVGCELDHDYFKDSLSRLSHYSRQGKLFL